MKTLNPRLKINHPLNIEQDFALILTASIDIKGMPKAYPTVAEQRQEDYYNSVKYYVNNQPRIQKIIFIENSGWPLDRVQEAIKDNPHNKKVEFISLNCNDFPRQLGKGYGECLLIEKGLEQSNLIQTVTHFAKITGRIYLKNMTQILERTEEYYDCLCDYKDQGWRIRKLWGEKYVGPHCDTRFLVFSRDFYQNYIKPLHQQHQKGCFYIETQFYDQIKSLEGEQKIINRFAIEPDFQGIAGHFGGKNYSSRKERTKFMIRAWTRKLIPTLHL
ncbi:conserved hypothetical protein [Rippkaea orientalis PCC 8801]|uniref:Uncharacterized protein n=1 Tax=Rippkaea orientalis (strain PCC 8801 / RF-1) TaxID=41431 RepID=B7K1G3_RIPO1|nr:hypothetical protein [Rippkaea orientalis]ACK67505.1 conserved hypothetical protein [Rippkaea orientalis PCC 8801]